MYGCIDTRVYTCMCKYPTHSVTRSRLNILCNGIFSVNQHFPSDFLRSLFNCPTLLSRVGQILLLVLLNKSNFVQLIY